MEEKSNYNNNTDLVNSVIDLLNRGTDLLNYGTDLLLCENQLCYVWHSINLRPTDMEV